MRDHAGLVILIATMIVAVAAFACVAADELLTGPPAAARESQALVGGAGLGPDLDMSACARSFDPRIAIDCSHRFDPIPMGEELVCSRHAMSVLPMR